MKHFFANVCVFKNSSNFRVALVFANVSAFRTYSINLSSSGGCLERPVELAVRLVERRATQIALLLQKEFQRKVWTRRAHFPKCPRVCYLPAACADIVFGLRAAHMSRFPTFQVTPHPQCVKLEVVWVLEIQVSNFPVFRDAKLGSHPGLGSYLGF